MDPLQPVLLEQAREELPTFVRIYVFIYLVLSGSHFLLLPDEFATWMTSLAALNVIFGVSLHFCMDVKLIRNHAETVLLVLLATMAVHSIAHLYFSADIKQSTNTIFVIVITGFLLPGYRPFYITLTGTLVAWLLLVVLNPRWTGDVIHFGFAVLMGAMFSVFLHRLRRGQLLQLRDLENTIHQLGESQKQVVVSESLLQKLMDDIPAGIMVRGPDARILYVNAELSRLIGYGREDMMGRSDVPIDLFTEAREQIPEHEHPVSRVLSGEVVTNEIYGIKRNTGEISWALTNAFSFVPEGSDDPLFVISFVDITERVIAEQQLRESENRVRTILNSVAEGVISVDQSDRVTLFNPGAESMTGFSADEALGQPLDKVLHYSEMATVQGGSDSYPMRQGTLTPRGGSEITIELHTSELLVSGQVLGRVLSLRDVSEQNRIEQERATLDKMSSVGVLAGGIAHDFNNLLTAIYGNVSLAESSIDDPSLALDYLKRTNESIKLATHLTKQLLTFATGSDPVRGAVDVVKMVREATRFALSGSSIALSFTIDPEAAIVEVDAGQMQQAIGNIVLNAKQALNDSGQIRIAICNDEDDSSFVRVTISDDGPGMDVEMLPRIFDPYFTTKSSGTGLGLATTHSIIVKHGGSISVESVPGKGTSFTLLLPKARGDKATEPEIISEPVQIDCALEVLVMDDEVIVLQTVTKLLEHLGHHVVGTKDGAEAIERYQARLEIGEPFDLVIMDLTVAGGMGGMEAANEILALNPEARLIVSSGYSVGAEMSRYRELGFCARLEKPFRSVELRQIIADVTAPQV